MTVSLGLEKVIGVSRRGSGAPETLIEVPRRVSSALETVIDMSMSLSEGPEGWYSAQGFTGHRHPSTVARGAGDGVGVNGAACGGSVRSRPEGALGETLIRA
jgi:hypothetical protein